MAGARRRRRPTHDQSRRRTGRQAAQGAPGDKFHLDKLHLDKLPTPAQFVESQFAFVQKLLDNSRRSSGASATTDEAPAEQAEEAADEVVIDVAPDADVAPEA